MGAQIKTLAFLAYIIRIYQETIAGHANLMVKGIIGLLTLCPPEVAHLRKELVIATRHILATDLRLSKYLHGKHAYNFTTKTKLITKMKNTCLANTCRTFS